MPYQIPFLAREVGGGLMQGVYAATDFWWTLEDKYPLAKMFVEAFEKKYGYKPEWGAENAYMQFAHLGRWPWRRRHLLSAGRHQGLREGRRRSSRLVGEVHYRAGGPPAASARSIIVKGKKPKDMKNKEDYWDVVEIVPGRGADAEARRVRLQARRLHLSTHASGAAGSYRLRRRVS